MKVKLLAAGLAFAWLPVLAQTPVDRRVVLLVDEIRAIRNVPVLVAEKLGYLKSDGMDIVLVNTRNEMPHAQMLADGRVDAVMAYYHHTIVNQSEGRDVQAIITLGVTPGAKVMISKQAQGRIHSLEQIKGSRFVTGGDGSSKTTVANYLVLRGGLALSDFKRLRTEGKESNAAALRDGSVDLLVAPTPDGDYYQQKADAGVFADLTTPEGTRKYFGALFPSSTIYMSSARLRERPDMARHLAKAFVLALRYINSHTPEEIAALIPEEATGKDKGAYLKILKEQLPMFATDGRMPEDGARKEWEVLKTFNPKLASVQVGATYTNAFVDQLLAAPAGQLAGNTP